MSQPQQNSLGGYNGNPLLRPFGVKIEYTREQILELAKCSTDPVYFIKKYIKIVSIDKGFINFPVRQFQEQLIKSFHVNRKTIGLLSRQVGKSTVVAAFFVWSILFNDNYTTAILANKESTAKEIFQKVTKAYEALPLWMQQGIVSWNKKSVELENGSRVIVGSTSSSAIRGYSINLLVLDEFGFVHRNVAEEFWTSVYPTISSGDSSKVIIISTPNGYNLFWKLYNEAEKGMNGFAHFKYTWKVVESRDEKWKQDQINTIGEQKFLQEHEVNFLGSTNTLINPNKIAELSPARPMFYTADTKIYAEPEFGRKYVISVDTGRGVEGDYSAFVVFDVTRYPFKVVAKYRSNTISPLLYPNIIHTVATKYNMAWVLVETNDNGQQVADILYQDLEYPNMISESFHTSVMGIRTTKLTKKIGCSNFKDLVETDKLLITDDDIILEITKFIQRKTSYEAEEGETDDLVMCCVMFSWLVRQPVFDMICDNRIQANLAAERAKAIEDSVLPFGFIENGLEENKIYQSLKQWMNNEEDGTEDEFSFFL